MVIEGRVNTMSIVERVRIKVATVWPNMSAFCVGAAEMTCNDPGHYPTIPVQV